MTSSTDQSACFTCTADRETAVVTFHRDQITDEDNIERIGERLFALVEQDGHRAVILNLSMVRYVTSSVLGKWITLHRKLSRLNGQLVLCHLQADLHEILDTSRLLTYFQSAETVDDARLLLSQTESGA